MSYEELKNNAEESEILSRDHEKVRGMCGGLKRVNAPKNFDFHLKARIANADKSDFQQSAFLPFLRYALPLSVVLLLAGFVAFSGFLTDGRNELTAETSQPKQTLNLAENSPANSAVTTASGNSSSEKSVNSALLATNSELKRSTANVEIAADKNKNNNLSAPKNIPLSEDFGGTRQSASRDSILISPPGFPSNRGISSANNAANFGGQSSISVKDALANIGIDADFVNLKWTVKSVKSSSLAARSNIKAGDLIESADNRKLDSETIMESSFSAKILYVLREGQRIAVELK